MATTRFTYRRDSEQASLHGWKCPCYAGATLSVSLGRPGEGRRAGIAVAGFPEGELGAVRCIARRILGGLARELSVAVRLETDSGDSLRYGQYSRPLGELLARLKPHRKAKA